LDIHRTVQAMYKYSWY